MNTKRMAGFMVSMLTLGFGVFGNSCSQDFAPLSDKKDASYAKEQRDKSISPGAMNLNPLLQSLAVAPDPEIFSARHGIFYTEGKVRVMIFFKPAVSDLEKDALAESFAFRIEKESNDIMRALVPIDNLIPLSEDIAVLSVRLPDKALK